MQVSVETFGTLGRRLTVAVPAEEVEKAYSARLQRLSRQVRVPGFRPGKVPLKIIEAQYGGRVMEEVAGDLIEESLKEAIGREGLRLAAGPRLQRKRLERGKQLEYTAEFEVLPEIPHLDLRGQRIERPVAAIAEEDVDRTIETIRRQRVAWKPVQREARMGDRVRIDFTGQLDGKEFEGGSAKNFSLVLGSNTLAGDLEQGLTGAVAGDRRRLSATFPADYRHAPLAGKTVVFEVTVHEVAEPELPALNEEFARSLGIADGSLEKLRAEVRANLEREAQSRSRAVVRARVLKALLGANDFEVPEGLLAAELAREMRMAQAARGGAVPAEEQAALRTRARSRVALGLILSEIVRTRGIRPDPARVRSRLEEMAAEYESPQAFMQWHYEDPRRMAEIESQVVEERAVEEALSTATVEDVTVSFQELMRLEG